jgi:glucose/arabinose dehydrogenase
MRSSARIRSATLPVLLAFLTGCTGSTDASLQSRAECDPDNGGLTLPDGFCAVVVADDLGAPRHMAVAPNGDLYVALRGGRNAAGGAVALRDTSGDGRADVTVRFDSVGGTGIELWRDWVYVGHDDGVVRYRRQAGELAPAAGAEVIVLGLRAGGGHAAKPVEITSEGVLFVNIGSPSNSCQVEDRRAGAPGKDPCEERESNGGIWRFSATMPNQTQADGARFAAGMRNTVALEHNPLDGNLYAAVHGRDQLHQNWGELYSEEEGAELPAEEFLRVQEGDDFGWPYCYYDQRQGRRVLAPEYGGDKQHVGRCAEMDTPLVAVPGHWAPNGLAFYDGDSFPERYRGGAFIAFHGSWNRAPRPQEGYQVVFVPRTGDGFGPEWEVFAEGFASGEKSPADAEHRPTGVTVGSDGSLYVSDDAGGRIWRVMYRP